MQEVRAALHSPCPTWGVGSPFEPGQGHMIVAPTKRLRTLAGLSAREIGARGEISLTAVQNVESGMYREVPVRLNRALAQAVRNAGFDGRKILETEYGDPTLNGAMDRWKTLKRQQHDLSAWPAMTLVQIMAEWRSSFAFCREMCIPTAALHNYEVGKVTGLPDVIQDALRDAGYEHVGSVR